MSSGQPAPSGVIGGWTNLGDVPLIVAWTDHDFTNANYYAEIKISGDLDNASVWFGGPPVLLHKDRTNAVAINPGPTGSEPKDLLKGKEIIASQPLQQQPVALPANRRAAKIRDAAPSWSPGFIALNSRPPPLLSTNSINMELVWIERVIGKGGTNLGSYWVGKYEVTQEEYEKVTGSNPSAFKAPRHPVEMISWNDAMAFCAKLTALEEAAGKLPKGMIYTLPTEEQWEYFVGNASLADAVTSEKEKRTSTENVGTKNANKFGLFDVRGNVWEWCLKQSNLELPFRVCRGSAWINVDTEYLVTSYRNTYPPDVRRNIFGLRVVLQEKP